MTIRTFDCRITVGKRKSRLTNGKAEKAHLYYPWGMYFNIGFPGQGVTVIDLPDMQIRFNSETPSAPYSALSIDGGIPLYKFITPTAVYDRYDRYEFVYHGIEFVFEIRLASVSEQV